jgi:hypothetical protein
MIKSLIDPKVFLRHRDDHQYKERLEADFRVREVSAEIQQEQTEITERNSLSPLLIPVEQLFYAFRVSGFGF